VECSSKQTPGPDFYSIHSRMQLELDTLRCVQAALRDAEDIDTNENLQSALSVLARAHTNVDSIHNELDEWHVHRKRV